MTTTIRAILAALCIGVIALCAVLIANRVTKRMRVADLTQQRLYSLSEGTKSILDKLNQPVTLKLYYSRVAARKGPEQIRFFNNYFMYVRDLMEEYVGLGRGKLRLEVIDPRPFSEEEEAALKHGIKRFQISEDESFFFGLVAATELGKEKSIEFFEPDRQEFVEYDVSKLLSDLMQREKRKIGVISSIGVMGDDMSPYMMQMLQMQGKRPQGPWTVIEDLKQSFDVEKVKIKDEPKIDEDIDFLAVIHPKNLDKKTLFAIDQFVMRGGKLLVFVDPHCLEDQPQQTPGNPMAGMQQKSSSDLNMLLATWGVTVDPERVVVDRLLAVTTQLQRNRPPEPFLPYLRLTADAVNDEELVNHNEVVTADLHSLQMLFAGAIHKTGKGKETIRMLLQTTSVGTTWKPANPFELRMPNPQTIRKAVGDGTKPQMLACIMEGPFESNFPDGIEVEDKDAEDKNGPDDADPEQGLAPQTDVDKAVACARDANMLVVTGEAAGPDKAAAKDETPAGDKTTDAKETDEGGKDGDQAKPGVDKAGTEDKPKRIKAIKESTAEAKILVVADVDCLSNRMAYRQTFFGMARSGDNAALMFNALDFLAGSDDLIHIRTRGRYDRPFKVVKQIEAKAEKATANEVEAINAKIESYRKQLEELGSSAKADNLELIHNAAMEKRRAVERDIREANKELRRLQARRRESVESLEFRIQLINIAVMPVIVLLIAIGLGAIRWARARRYTARRV